MSSGVAIVGVAQTRYEANKDHLAYNELVYEVVAQLLRETGVKMADIHSQITASQDMFDGKTISSMSVNEVVGGYLKSEAKVAADGLQAVLYGAARILSGSFEYTLITAHAKESESCRPAVTVSMFDPFTQRPLGLHDAIASGLQAQRYLHSSGLTTEDLAELSRRRHLDARKNPLAQRAGDFSTKQIMESPQVAGPLRELMVSPSSDGACAVLLASAEKAAAFGKRAVWIAGMGNCTDAYWTERDLATTRALAVAGAKAYRAARIGDPAKELDLAEISARSAHEEPLFARSLQLFDGYARKWVEKQGKGAGTAVNPSGGAITGNPTSVAGLTRLAEAYLQLSGQAGEHQVADARTALAHAADGICGQGHSVVILRADSGN
jgi:acetyl-CoA C-acetyltransferase